MAKNKASRKDWFKLWARDIVTSLDWQKMSLEERGAYCSLLFQSWIEWPDVSLPSDKRTIRVVCNADAGRKFDRILQTVLQKFETVDGRIFNSKLRKQRDEIIEESEVKALAGAKGGVAKGKQNGSTCLPDAKQMGSHKEVEVEREKEGELETVSPSIVPEEDVQVNTAIKRLSAIWQEIKGKGAHLPKPDDRYRTLSRFKQFCEQNDKLLPDAFRAWAIAEGDGRDPYPLNKFVNVAADYLKQVDASLKGFSEVTVDPEEEAQRLRAIEAGRARDREINQIPDEDKEPELAAGESF